jgi:hypothetical protein
LNRMRSIGPALVSGELHELVGQAVASKEEAA